jgi:hypothetical protein
MEAEQILMQINALDGPPADAGRELPQAGLRARMIGLTADAFDVSGRQVVLKWSTPSASSDVSRPSTSM